MKRTLILLAFGWILQPSFTKALATEAPVKEVYIYLQGARLVHQLQLDLVQGAQTVRIAGLADGADEASTRLMLPKGLQLMHYQWQHLSLRSLPEPWPLKAGYDSLHLWRADLEELRMRKDVLQQEQQLLLANKQLGGTQGVQVAELQKMATYFRQRLGELGKSLLDIQQQEKKLLMQADELKKSLEERKASLAAYENVIQAEVVAQKAGSQTLEISYNCDQVSWSPTYVIRSEGPGKPIQLTMQAEISQQTGLAWKNVKVKLAAFMPASQLQKPVLTPWFLDFLELRPITSQRYSDAPSPASARAFEKANLADSDGVENWAGVQRDNRFFTAVYQPETALNLRHGEQTRLRIEQRELPATYEHFLAPRQSQEVLLLARIPLTDSLPQLPGQTQIYFENSLVNTVWLNFAAENDTLDLPLGVDKALVVKFNNMPVVSDKKRLGNTAIKQFSYQLEVKNNRNQAVQLVVQDQLPITAQKEIEITEVELQGAGLEKESGIFTQFLAIAPGGNKSWKYGWQVRYPANKRVAGL